MTLDEAQANLLEALVAHVNSIQAKVVPAKQGAMLDALDAFKEARKAEEEVARRIAENWTLANPDDVFKEEA